MTYQWLREFADSWALLFMFLLYAALIGWVFLPRNKDSNARAKTSIFEKDDIDG